MKKITLFLQIQLIIIIKYLVSAIVFMSTTIHADPGVNFSQPCECTS